MPAMPLSAFSIGMITADVISSGAAPGRRSETLTLAGSAFGKRSTPRSRKEKMPSTTSDITSIVANTGRRTQISESMVACLAFARFGRDAQAIGEVVDIRRGDLVARTDPTENLDAIADT